MNNYNRTMKNEDKKNNSTIKGIVKVFSNTLSDGLTKAGNSAAKKVGDAFGDAGAEVIKSVGDSVAKSGSQAVEKVTKAFGDKGKIVAEKAGELFTGAEDSAEKLKETLAEQKKQIEEKGFSETAMATTQQMITKVAALPVVRVNREEFLRKTFGRSKYIEEIVAQGPQAVFTTEALRDKANEIISSSTRKTSAASFVAGLPSNVVAMVAAGAADITQYFAFALNLAQQIAYLFGEDEIFSNVDQVALAIAGKDDLKLKDGTAVPEEAQVRLISYLGAMMGVSGAGTLILKTSQKAGANIGKKVAAKALTKTAWYPLVKKTASLLGYKITKKTVESVISKAVPVIGGALSGGITYITFRPMGGKLADEFVKIQNGEYDKELELNPEFLAKENLKKELDAEFMEVEVAEDNS